MRSAKSTMPRMKKSKDVNVVYEGSPSRMRSVRRISFGITTRPSSSDCVNQVQKNFVKPQNALKTLGFSAFGTITKQSNPTNRLSHFRTKIDILLQRLSQPLPTGSFYAVANRSLNFQMISIFWLSVTLIRSTASYIISLRASSFMELVRSTSV